MIWLTWRQHRWQLIGTAAALAAYWAFLIHAGFAARGALAGCPPFSAVKPVPSSCYEQSNAVHGTYTTMRELLIFGNLLPLVAGMFWGAPMLARELEQGTFRLAFTQSVSRRRWLAVKLGTLAGCAAVLGLGTGAIVTWNTHQFASPMFDAQPFGDITTFSQAGLVPAAAWVFALLTGVTLGLLLRRGMAAVALSLVVLPLVFTGLVALRPHYLPPVERLVGSAQMRFDPSPETGPDGWLYGLSYVDAAGRELDSAGAGKICADPSNTYPTAECLDRTGMRQRIVYQPADRYIWFQLIEAGLLLAVSGALVLVIRRGVTRHL